MLSFIRHSIYTKIFCGLLGLYLLNISVDPKDLQPDYIPEDLSFNDQESFVEIVLEKMLGFEDAIAEYDDCDSDEQNKKKSSKTELLVYTVKADNNPQNPFIELGNIFPYLNEATSIGFLEIDCPPPKS